jgi:hypothetical protein
MKQPALFDLPPRDLTRSKSAAIDAFIAAHGILTHYAKNCAPNRWMALMPRPDDKGKDIGTIMASGASMYDEEVGNCVTAPSRLSAVRELAKFQKIPCDL